MEKKDLGSPKMDLAYHIDAAQVNLAQDIGSEMKKCDCYVDSVSYHVVHIVAHKIAEVVDNLHYSVRCKMWDYFDEMNGCVVGEHWLGHCDIEDAWLNVCTMVYLLDRRQSLLADGQNSHLVEPEEFVVASQLVGFPGNLPAVYVKLKEFK